MSLKNQHTTADYLPWDENIRLLKSLHNDKDYTYYLIVMFGSFWGIRISDILLLKWEDILQKEKVIINEKKTDKRRIIKINDYVYQSITDCYIDMKPNTKKVFNLTTQAINAKFKRLKKKHALHIENFSTHTLRKTFGRKVLEDNNWSYEAFILLMDIFNHSSLATTKRYLGIRQEEINSIYDKINIEI